jgi:hypothetical protein
MAEIIVIADGLRVAGHDRDLPHRGATTFNYAKMVRCGRLAQLVEHRLYTPGVTGSSPVPPTQFNADCGLQTDDCILDCGLMIVLRIAD